MLLNVRKMAQWIAHAILHAVLIYFIPFFAWRWAGSWKSECVVCSACGTVVGRVALTTIFPGDVCVYSGKEDGLYSFGVVVYTGLILSMHWQV